MELHSAREQNPSSDSRLRRGVFLLPATITSIGLLSGFYSIVSAVSGHFEVAAVLIGLAFVCDGLDGRVARASRTSSHFGVEYDSLSDLVAFGVAPAMLMYSWALKPIGSTGIAISGLFVICAALRLARFNVQTATADKHRFTGLPVPGAAAMIAGMALAYSYFELDSPRTLCAFMAPITLALAGLMISRVPYPSFKTLKLDKRAQVELVIAMVVFAAMLFAMPQLTAFLISTAYVLSGPILLVRGEQMRAKVSVLRPVAVEKPHAANGASPRPARPTGSLPAPTVDHE
ncbi:MAG: CDP-diacylglycerol--serine O-phosphatidyltransferase [Candidatus Binatus sp.]|uniref:CDP-diacylglycerol--serine O-phosphatidyltransferase n=1 Tax=Candidatus Binatus sp. TaxID=2811406 RepID=UPI00271D56D0|nr:CDP-diacylglycerol--serine O-phosphatidyltransferase [Candidatus Binatus sp.]MDO8433653.1 CDP-diacylglycerol--serine O-phosphatidyltransferase [Candidatus Binatus sp.]